MDRGLPGLAHLPITPLPIVYCDGSWLCFPGDPAAGGVSGPPGVLVARVRLPAGCGLWGKPLLTLPGLKTSEYGRSLSVWGGGVNDLE